MFGLFRRDPVKQLRREFELKRVQARDLQRNGDIIGYANMTAAAEEILERLEETEAKQLDRAR